MSSTFLDFDSISRSNSVAALYLRRNHYLPLVLESKGNKDAVVHTRFGSFPHSTLLKLPWGTQVAASKVNGKGEAASSKGRRKREHRNEATSDVDSGGSSMQMASKGFLYVLPPTPETWTLSLPHRTQVVYTPDYSYILQRLQIRPGTTVIEAGAGSGSFTHAAARAVFIGQSNKYVYDVHNDILTPVEFPRYGHVYSFEFHEARSAGLRKELEQHKLSETVTVTHRDVCKSGFRLSDDEDDDMHTKLYANAVFLDLPMPWLALPHLQRHKSSFKPNEKMKGKLSSKEDLEIRNEDGHVENESDNSCHRSATTLDQREAIQLCSFSPCIEQVQRTVIELRKLGWLEVEVVELQHRDFDVRRERQGLHEEGLRGVNASAANVHEAIVRQRQVEERLKAFHSITQESRKSDMEISMNDGDKWEKTIASLGPSKQERLNQNRFREANRKLYKDGRVSHKTDQELKTHTSYLTFAVLTL